MIYASIETPIGMYVFMDYMFCQQNYRRFKFCLSQIDLEVIHFVQNNKGQHKKGII